MRSLISGGSLLLAATSLTLAGPAHAATPERAAAAPSITIAVKSDQVERGQKVVVTGSVGGRKVTRVTLQQKRRGSRWKSQATVKVRADGSYRLKDKTTTAVTREYRVVSATGPRTKSATVEVGVFAWRDMTDMSSRSNTGWGIYSPPTINGVSYGDAWVTYGGPEVPALASVDFNVNRECIAFRARIGLSDASDSAGRATISVVADDVAAYSKSFGLTESELVTVPLAHPFRVGFISTVENPGGTDPAPRASAAVAQPELYCSASK